jgi:hypothetical protein
MLTQGTFQRWQHSPNCCDCSIVTYRKRRQANLKVIQVYLEIGKKRTFAGAIDWPGWCRSGRDEASALGGLFDYGPRYAQVLQAAPIQFQAPVDSSSLVVIERLEGNTTTDFGAPAIAPASDRQPVDHTEFQRFQTLMEAYWEAFDAAVDRAEGHELRKGPRGGGRDLEAIVRHVLDADAGYLKRLAWKQKKGDGENLGQELRQTRQAVLDALAAAVQGDVPERGPRGGVIWTPRYFVRRVAWHVLDHQWEIQDRVI